MTDKIALSGKFRFKAANGYTVEVPTVPAKDPIFVSEAVMTEIQQAFEAQQKQKAELAAQAPAASTVEAAPAEALPVEAAPVEAAQPTANAFETY